MRFASWVVFCAILATVVSAAPARADRVNLIVACPDVPVGGGGGIIDVIHNPPRVMIVMSLFVRTEAPVLKTPDQDVFQEVFPPDLNACDDTSQCLPRVGCPWDGLALPRLALALP